MLGAGRTPSTPLARANASAKSVFAPSIPLAEGLLVTEQGPALCTMTRSASTVTHRMTGIGWSVGSRPDRHDVLAVAGVHDQQPVTLERARTRRWARPRTAVPRHPGLRLHRPPLHLAQRVGRARSPRLPPLGVHPRPDRVDDHFGDRVTEQRRGGVHRAIVSRRCGLTKPRPHNLPTLSHIGHGLHGWLQRWRPADSARTQLAVHPQSRLFAACASLPARGS